jgi:hypothetical protein
MTISLPRTLRLRSLLSAALAAAFARAGQSRHHRLGSAFAPAQPLHDLQDRAMRASGTPLLPPSDERHR